jgi:bifunctional DNA-binding transcriptional regulator/antitoxin component of YhaV-PrlF toxin-antitoxin module
MALVAVKSKYQVVIPQGVREQIGVNVGDLLEARIERGKITFTPQSLLNRGIAEGLADIKAGRIHGPYRTTAEAMKAFQERTAKLSKRTNRKASQPMELAFAERFDRSLRQVPAPVQRAFWK